jgi:hypothetical protein
VPAAGRSRGAGPFDCRLRSYAPRQPLRKNAVQSTAAHARAHYANCVIRPKLMAIFAFWLVVLAAVCPTAYAAKRIIGHWVDRDLNNFEGERCGETDLVSLSLRPNAFNIKMLEPKIGAALRDGYYPELIAARVTDFYVRRAGSQSTAIWVGTGSDGVCSGVYPDATWNTQTVPFRVRYKTRERAYIPDRCGRGRYKPRRVVVGCGILGNLYLPITGIRWRGWNRTVASGVGTAHANICIPTCVAGNTRPYAVAIRAYRPHFCSDDGVFQYRRLRVTYLNNRPAQIRSFSAPFPCSL